MSWGILALLGVLGILFLIVGAATSALRRRREQDDPTPPPTSLSLLAGLSFFCGLGAILLVTATGILSLILSMDDLLRVPSDARPAIDLAGKIVLYLSLLPAVGAVAFALAARGVISESRNTLRGRPLYRTGMLLSIVTGIVVLDAKIVSPATWAAAGQSFVRKARNFSEIDLDRGYLGIEHEGVVGPARILRVVPGSPAEKAGVRVGDVITHLDGSPLGRGQSLAERIGSRKPGTKILLGGHRNGQVLSVTAELATSFGSLLAMLELQDLDEERLTVLQAVGSDRRYTADEVGKICGAFEGDDGRLRAIEAALPHLQDPQNSYQILGSLESADAKSQVSAWIARKAESPK